jgi:hypothetical protein
MTCIVLFLAGYGACGLQDGPALSAKFNGPRGIVLDYSGNLFVADRCGSGCNGLALELGMSRT